MLFYKINNSPMGANKEKILRDLDDVDVFSKVFDGEDTTLLVNTKAQTDYKVIAEAGSVETNVLLVLDNDSVERDFTIEVKNNSTNPLHIFFNAIEGDGEIVEAGATKVFSLRNSGGSIINKFSLFGIAPSAPSVPISAEKNIIDKDSYIFIMDIGDTFSDDPDVYCATLEDYHEFCKNNKIRLTYNNDVMYVILNVSAHMYADKVFQPKEGIIPIPEIETRMTTGVTGAKTPMAGYMCYLFDLEPEDEPFQVQPIGDPDTFTVENTVGLFDVSYLNPNSGVLIGLTTEGNYMKLSNDYVALDLANTPSARINSLSFTFYQAKVPNMVISNTYANNCKIFFEDETVFSFADEIYGAPVIVYPNANKTVLEFRGQDLDIIKGGDGDSPDLDAVVKVLSTTEYNTQGKIDILFDDGSMAGDSFGGQTKAYIDFALPQNIDTKIIIGDFSVTVDDSNTARDGFLTFAGSFCPIKLLASKDSLNRDFDDWTFNIKCNYIGTEIVDSEMFDVPDDAVNVIDLDGNYISTGEPMSLATNEEEDDEDNGDE